MPDQDPDDLSVIEDHRDGDVREHRRFATRVEGLKHHHREQATPVGLASDRHAVAEQLTANHAEHELVVLHARRPAVVGQPVEVVPQAEFELRDDRRGDPSGRLRRDLAEIDAAHLHRLTLCLEHRLVGVLKQADHASEQLDLIDGDHLDTEPRPQDRRAAFDRFEGGLVAADLADAHAPRHVPYCPSCGDEVAELGNLLLAAGLALANVVIVVDPVVGHELRGGLESTPGIGLARAVGVRVAIVGREEQHR